MAAEWEITAVPDNNNGFRFRFYSTEQNDLVKHDTSRNVLFFNDIDLGASWLNNLSPVTTDDDPRETDFRLVATTGCNTFTEMPTNVAGDATVLQGNVTDMVRGFVDPHTHYFIRIHGW